MKRAPEHALSVLKPNSFVLKWKCVVSMLSPLSLFSRGGSQIASQLLFLSSQLFLFIHISIAFNRSQWKKILQV